MAIEDMRQCRSVTNSSLGSTKRRDDEEAAFARYRGIANKRDTMSVRRPGRATIAGRMRCEPKGRRSAVHELHINVEIVLLFAAPYEGNLTSVWRECRLVLTAQVIRKRPDVKRGHIRFGKTPEQI